MNWEAAIEHHRMALLRLVLALLTTAMIASAGSTRLPRCVRQTILQVLKPAESACRRLIMIEAQKLKVSPRGKRAAPNGKIPRGSGDRVPSFPLFDPRKRFDRDPRRRAAPDPRMSTPGVFDPDFSENKPASPDDMMDAETLLRRLQSLHRALENLPKQAQRLARLLAKRRQDEKTTPRQVMPMRPGWPPGYRIRHPHPVDAILAECHGLARWAMETPAPEP